MWNRHIGLDISRARYKSKSDILVFTAAGPSAYFDGPGNTIAWSEMPCGEKDRQIKQAYDWDEPWTADLARRPGILALSVMAHEMGHALGLDHSENPGELMAPFYNPTVIKPTPGDIQRIQELYGEPASGGDFVANVRGQLTATDEGVSLDLTYVS
jgi:hypothetical protein